MMDIMNLHTFPGRSGGGTVFVETVVTVIHVNKPHHVVVQPNIPFALQINQLQPMGYS
jgi:hypothetical protein